jgi:hypothetical protein
LGLSVEGKLSANDGAEISGMLKYGNIGSYKDHSSVAFEDNSGSSFHVPTVEGKDDKTLLIVGDSWTNTGTYAEGTILAKTFEKYYSKVYNYGINGASATQVGDMCKQAYNDGVRPDVIIAICGTNDVFWGSNAPDATEAFSSVNDYYKTVPKYYFPNNSKKANLGHGSWYTNLLVSAARGGWCANAESLYTLLNLIGYYAGDDDYGVQHLSSDGQVLFAQYVHVLMQGGINGVDGLMSIDASDCTIKVDGSETTGAVLMTYRKDFNGAGIIGLHVELEKAITGTVTVERNCSSRTSGTPVWIKSDNHIAETSSGKAVFVGFGEQSVTIPFDNCKWVRTFVSVPFPF